MAMTLREKLDHVRAVDETKHEMETYKGGLKTTKNETLKKYYTNQIAKLTVRLYELRTSVET
jgi:hypothetical protein